MLGAVFRMFFRIIGWFLTPLVVTGVAVVGATFGFLVAGTWDNPMSTVVLALICGLIGSVLGTMGWTRLLRRNPALREALAVTASGLPEPDAVHEMLQSVSLEEKPHS